MFWDAWRGPDDGSVESPPWLRVRVPSSECPRIDPAYLAEMRRTMGTWAYGSEFGAEFLDAKTAAFSDDDIQRAFSEPYESWGERVAATLPPLSAYAAYTAYAAPAPTRETPSRVPFPTEPASPTGPTEPDPWERLATGYPIYAHQLQMQPLGSLRPPNRPAAYDAVLEATDPIWRTLGRR